ncbi:MULTISPECIES: histidine phosphatase family protein [Paenibacillus]|uniref:Phosphoglycerate mutase n=2 Tax=Paenibacillus lactis TaxID=228574 RepID=G4H9F2_9BACL|nr:histidine phosphatase family protein [Paenibacillus lactis]EHB68487.1 Phosphoglycerate mutase [Paenibacillus lactis 154]MBP1893486.1 broad specificity phosphatase PhoE [Paenibacillus lactis]MCM3496947.1 histidine phosphatase family protein [Paenibacillus lactis]
MIGIVRHFKVTYKPENKWMTAKQFNNWVEEYDKAEIQIANNISNDRKWDVCYCSNQSRATRTAKVIFDGEIIITDQLREIGITAVSKSKIKLHLTIWLILARIAWFLSHKSQEESKLQTLSRAKLILDEIEQKYSETNVLIVSHGAFIKTLTKELDRRGYKGKVDIKPRNGKLYTYNKQ